MRLKEIRYKSLLYYRIIRNLLDKSAGIISFLASLATLCLLIYEIGFHESPEVLEFLKNAYRYLLRIFFYTACVRILINPKGFRREKGFWFEIVILLCLLGVIVTDPSKQTSLPEWIWKLHSISGYIILIFISIIHFSKQIVSGLQRHIKPEMMFAYSFLFIILCGSLLLSLPNAHCTPLNYIDALFTSTSAVCVTGLITVDTATTFTPTGLIILISLIQIGGIGVMTFTSFFAMSFFCQVSFRDQISLKNILNENSLNDIFRTLFYILVTTFLIELTGTYIIYQQISHLSEEVIPNKFFFAVFHAISAFCNAGFSTLEGNLHNPHVKNLYGLQATIATLIILGGIGYPILFNFGRLFRYRIRNGINRLKGSPLHYEKQVHLISLTTRIVLPATFILIISGTLLFWLFENDNTLKDLPFIGKLAISYANAATTRTAGFNNVDMSSLLPGTIFLFMLLMWIGASPMSTGGGIKTTTFIVALKNVISVIRNKEKVEIAHRQIPSETVNRANAIIFISLLWIGTATLLLTYTEASIPVTNALFEVVSALSTVGLTLEQTSLLSDTGKVIIMLTMFAGRVGLIILLTGLIRQQTAQSFTYPDEQVIL